MKEGMQDEDLQQTSVLLFHALPNQIQMASPCHRYVITECAPHYFVFSGKEEFTLLVWKYGIVPVVKWLNQGHRESQWQSQEFTTDFQISIPVP